MAAYRLYGALFFGAVKLIADLQDRLQGECLVLDLKNLIYIDSSGADALNDLARACRKHGVQLRVCGLTHQPLDICQRCGFLDAVGVDHIHPHLATAMAAALTPQPDPTRAP